MGREGRWIFRNTHPFHLFIQDHFVLFYISLNGMRGGKNLTDNKAE